LAKKHLYEIDLMRAFIMLGVLSVHTVTLYMARLQDMTPSFLTVGAVHTSMHFTRESFMFITGLVLFVTYYHRVFNPLTFWWKRLTLIAVPYIVWNILYILFEGTYNTSFDGSLMSLLHQLEYSLKTGNQFYLYYVLVSIQLYIIFPFLLFGLRKFERWHLQIFIVSFLIQLLLMYLDKFPPTTGADWPYILSKIYQYRDRFVLTYQFWFIAGGIVACNYGRIQSFMERHARALRLALLVGAVIVWAHYFFDRLVLNESDGVAEIVLQPIMIPYSLVVTANLWYAGIQWARRRTLPSWQRFSRFVGIASSASFGIYLLQPFPLYLTRMTVNTMNVPKWLYFSSIPFAILFVYFSGMVIAHWLGKIPIIAYCVGRKVNVTRHKSSPVSTTA